MRFSLILVILFLFIITPLFAADFSIVQETQAVSSGSLSADELSAVRKVLSEGTDQQVIAKLEEIKRMGSRAELLIPDIIALFSRYKNDSIGRVSGVGARTLAGIGDAFLSYIDVHYEGFDSVTASGVMQALQYFGGKSFPVTKKIMERNYHDYRFMLTATLVLGFMGEKAAPELLNIVKNHENPTIRQNAALSLRTLAAYKVDIKPALDIALSNFETEVKVNGNLPGLIQAALKQYSPTELRSGQIESLLAIGKQKKAEPSAIVVIMTALSDTLGTVPPEAETIVIPYLDEKMDQLTRLSAALLFLKYGKHMESVEPIIRSQLILKQEKNETYLQVDNKNKKPYLQNYRITCSLNLTAMLGNYAPYAQVFTDDLVKIYYLGGACQGNSLSSLRKLASSSPKAIGVFKDAMKKENKYIQWSGAIGLAKNGIFSEEVKYYLKQCIADPDKMMAEDCSKFKLDSDT